MKGRRHRPFQFGLFSIFVLMTAVAIALGLGAEYWLHLLGVALDLSVMLTGLSIAAGLLCIPYLAVVGLAKVLEVARDVAFAIQDRREESRHQDNRADG